ncbi:DUF5655 domain-containing protein [Streptomyces sp. NPDC001130]
MTELMLFRRDGDGQDVELPGSTVALEVELQRRVEAGLEAMLGIRFLASEYPTGPWHRGRIDTLGLDENGSPVVIEYKKGSDNGVVTQAISYLRWLRTSPHEFNALVKEVLGTEVAESLDWRAPRAVCIAANFSHHDRVTVQEVGKRIDLVRYRVFDGGLLSLQLVESAPGISGTGPVRRWPPAQEVASNAGNEVLEAGMPGTVEVPESLRALFDELDEMLTASGEVEVAALKHYIAYRRLVNVASVLFRPGNGEILMYLKVDPSTVDLEKGFTRDVRGIGHLGTGDLEVRIASAANLVKARPLIQRAVEAT